MRKELVIPLADGVAALKEMTPMDLYLMLTNHIALSGELVRWADINSEQWDNFFVSFGMIEVSGKASDDELSMIRTVFESINNSFFSKNATRETVTQKPGLLLTTIIKNLEATCAQLVSRHHQQCWQYGWSFFLSTQAIYQDK